MTRPSLLWLYRTLEVDDDGDPLDAGVIRAVDEASALAHLKTRLAEVFGAATLRGLTVRLYPLADVADGVLGPSAGFRDVADFAEAA